MALKFSVPVENWGAICKEQNPNNSMNKNHSFSRRGFLAAGVAAATMPALSVSAADDPVVKTVRPPEGKTILLSCKLGMISGKRDGKEVSLTERLKMAGEAGFDGVDFDQAAGFTPEQARTAVQESGVFVHNAINHAHWSKRLTSSKDEDRKQARANIEHCMRVSHAAGGNGVLIVVGQGGDGPAAEIEERCRQEIRSMIPLAASLGQPILIENVWNKMFYNHGGKPEQSADQFVKFVDSFNSPWVGMYFDIGNHWKYGQPGDWIRSFGYRCVKLDVKGFSREKNKFTEIGEGDLPWGEVRKALKDINFTGWATAEVGGGDVERLTVVRKQMQKVFGLA